jgi:hypothetical protein
MTTPSTACWYETAQRQRRSSIALESHIGIGAPSSPASIFAAFVFEEIAHEAFHQQPPFCSHDFERQEATQLGFARLSLEGSIRAATLLHVVGGHVVGGRAATRIEPNKREENA